VDSDNPLDDSALDGGMALAMARAETELLRAELAATQRRLAELEVLADRDPLTPVLNRRAFLRELQRTLAYCERYETEASLAFFDMDGFKAVNDRFGHAAGDAALQWVAAVLAAHVRESDLVGRLGGDEFAVVLAHAGLETAEPKARQLASAVEADPVVFEGHAIPLRVSFGVRALAPGMTAAELIAEADAAMFLAKGSRAGR
jgi:diguanylate cyclase (GGDEF)-like protein